MVRRSSAIFVVVGLFMLCGLSQPAGGQTSLANVNVGTNPISAAVNPVTNKVYVANQSSASVTVIDGATNSTATVNVGTSPYWVAVNTVTNKIYVANRDSANVTVIDGVTNSTSTVSAGTNPRSLAVNPVTNKIYVANQGSNNVTVIDGVTNSTATVSAGTAPYSVAVNPVTNKIYVGNDSSNNVTVIDGATNSAVTVNVGSAPESVAVNPVTNQIYVANLGSANVTVIDGAANTTTTLGVGSSPRSIVVNPVTNKIYVANLSSVTIIDGATNLTATISGGIAPISPASLAVNTLNNKIYVANSAGANVTVIDGATNSTNTVGAGTNPISVAVNPVTNKIYVANYGGANVTLIDGTTYSTSTVATAAVASSVAVNPVTNKIYVANENSTVTVIDGATNSTATVAVGSNPFAVAVNPLTNKIYIANQNSANVTVIDGATNSTSTVSVGTSPYSVAINTVTNKIYVVNYNSANVTVIDGATNSTVTLGSNAANPTSVAVNPVTNKVYVGNTDATSVMVIDGATNSILTVNVAIIPFSVAVNPMTNKIYVTGSNTNFVVTVIDGASNSTVNVFGVGGASVAVNPVTNKIYVAGYTSLTVIDGATNSTVNVGSGAGSASSVAVNPASNKIYTNSGYVVDGATNSVVDLGFFGGSVAVNPVTNKTYADSSGSNITVITEQYVVTPLSTNIASLPNNLTNIVTPSFIFSGQTTFSPNAPGIQDVLYQVDTWQGAWLSSAPSFSGATPALQAGVHILYAYAADSQAATSTQAGSPLVGNIAAYLFVVDPPSFVTASTGTPQSAGVNEAFGTTLRATVTLASGLPVSGATVTFAAPSSGASGSFAPNASTAATATTNASGVASAPAFTANATTGSYTVTATVAGIAIPASFSLTNNFTNPAITALSATSAVAGSPGFVLTVTGSGFVSGAAVLWNGSSRVTTVISSTMLNASITASDVSSAGNYQVSVANPSGGPSNALQFTVLNPVPTLFSLSPSSATSGASSFTLTVSGANFINGAAVWWNGNARSTTFTSSTSLAASITTVDLAAGGTIPVTVVNPAPNAGASTAINFTVNNLVPVLNSLSTTSAPAGTAGVVVTVTGSGFVNGATVQVNGTARTTAFNSSTSLGGALTTSDLAAPMTLSITVRNPNPTTIASNSLAFTVTGNNPIPAVANLSPSTVGSGSGGFTLTVFGSNFAPASTVLWNGSSRPTTFASSQQLSASISAADVASAATIPVTVFSPTPGGGTSSAISFTVGSSSQGSVAAQSLNGGATLTVSVPIVLTLNNGATIGALSLGLRVVPGAGAPPIAANLAFQNDAALPATAPNASNTTTSDLALFWSAFTTPLSGTVTLGVLQIPIPAAAAVGQTYAVQVTGAGAAQSNAAIPVTIGADGTLSIVETYLEGDVFPATSDTVGNFGDGVINTLDLLEVLRMVAGVLPNPPKPCSDRFDAMDVWPLDTPTTPGGDKMINTLDLLATLRRSVNLDTSRPVRIPRGLACSSAAPEGRRPPEEPAEGVIEVEGNAVYLRAQRDLNLAGLALSLRLPDNSPARYTPGSARVAILDLDQPGLIAMAWLDGITLTSGSRLLLGYVDGADGGKVIGVAANEAGGRDVRIIPSNALRK